MTSFGCRDQGRDSVRPVLWMSTWRTSKKARVNGGSNYDSLEDSQKTLSGLRGDVRIPFIARWKARGRFPDNWSFRCLLRLWRHKRKSVEVRTFSKGRVTLRLNCRLTSYCSRQYLWTLDRVLAYYNFAAGSFQTKKLCSRLYSIEVYFYSKKWKKSLFEPPFLDLGATTY